jgi:transposase
VGRRIAGNLVAELGPEMKPTFPSAGHLASWAGMCPGNNESAGKRQSGRTPKGNRWLRRSLIEAGWAAARTKHTYLAAQYRRLAARRGKRRAVVAVGHTILVSAYHILAQACPYAELGADHFDRLDPQRLTRHLVRRLQRLGHKVTLEPIAA